MDAGSPAISSFFRTKLTVTILIQFPENASIHLSIQPSSNPLFAHSFFLLLMPSSVQAFIYPSFSLHFITSSSLSLSSLRSDIRLSAYLLSICLSTHPAVRPFSHSSSSLQSIFTPFILLSTLSYFIQISVLSILSA